jgi:hypothetical protein
VLVIESSRNKGGKKIRMGEKIAVQLSLVDTWLGSDHFEVLGVSKNEMVCLLAACFRHAVHLKLCEHKAYMMNCCCLVCFVIVVAVVCHY